MFIEPSAGEERTGVAGALNTVVKLHVADHGLLPMLLSGELRVASLDAKPEAAR